MGSKKENHVVKFNILAVEDNKNVMGMLKSNLWQEHGFTLYQAERISQARNILRIHHIDLVVLDLGLPDGRGDDFCQEIKMNPSYGKIKVIILTNQTSVRDRIRSFEKGADDYVPKPFFPEEMLIRIKLLLGINAKDRLGNELMFKYKGYTLDCWRRELYSKGAVTQLTNIETIVLSWLMRNPNGTKHTTLQKYLSEQRGRDMSYNALRVNMKRLRDKLERQTGVGLVKNRHGVGYYLGV